MGQNDDIGQLKLVKCTYPDCSKRFDTEKEMKYHKLDDPEHFYCKKCDVDCEDDDHLKLHKVVAMAPWVEGRMKGNKDESPKHIVCEFCGMDFKSFGGRKIHREQMHPADQHIKCPGCPAVFTRAGNLLAHFENNQCESVSRREFLGHVQQKHVIKEIMKNPHDFRQNLLMNQLTSENPGLIQAASEAQDTEEGGINLLDGDDEHQGGGIQPLQAEVNLIEMNEGLQLNQSTRERWPRLSEPNPRQLSQPTRKLSMMSSTTDNESVRGSVHGSQMSTSEFASQITSRRGGNKIYTESLTSPQSPNMSAFMSDEDDTASLASSTNGFGAWSAGRSSQVLFKGAKPTPPTADWDRVLKKRQEEAHAASTTNMFHSRFWDPTSKEFDVLIFKNGLTQQYHCPFEGCEDAVYDFHEDLTGHLRHAHLKTNYRCPLCLKIFSSASALIGHSESAGKCKVKKSSKYNDLLNEVSGGFLKAEHLQEPKIARGKDGGLWNGIMTTRFTAKMPNEE